MTVDNKTTADPAINAGCVQTGNAKLAALQRLHDAVMEGNSDIATLCSFAAFGDLIDSGLPVSVFVGWIMDPADIRAMGAAKALHEALVPGWDLMISTYEDGLFEVSVSEPLVVKTYDGLSEAISIAWLAAIIKALMAQEGE